MLVDGLRITPNGALIGFKTATGSAFPSDPSDGQTFRLTAAVGATPAGLYWYDISGAGSWQPTGDITAVTAGSGLTGGGTSGALSVELDLTFLNDHTDGRYLPLDGGAMLGALTLSDNPTLALHAATKQYVDGLAQGLDTKASVRAATTINIVLSGTQTLDDVDMNVEDRALVKNQTDATKNGLYVVKAGAWVRATDADSSAKVTTGMYTFVEEGTAHGSQGWNLLTHNVVLGTTSLVFTQFGAAQTYTAGSGISINGSAISATPYTAGLGVDITGFVVSANLYDIAGSILGKPASSAVTSRFVAARAFSIPSALAGSIAKCATTATTSTVLTLAKNGTSFGTITFGAGSGSGTLAAASATTFAVGDVLTVTAPVTADATFADCEYTIAATLI